MRIYPQNFSPIAVQEPWYFQKAKWGKNPPPEWPRCLTSYPYDLSYLIFESPYFSPKTRPPCGADIFRQMTRFFVLSGSLSCRGSPEKYWDSQKLQKSRQKIDFFSKIWDFGPKSALQPGSMGHISTFISAEMFAEPQTIWIWKRVCVAC